MSLNTRAAQEIAVASDLLVMRLGELLVSKGIVTTAEAAAVIDAARKDALAPPGWQTGPKAAEIIDQVGRLWTQAKG